MEKSLSLILKSLSNFIRFKKAGIWCTAPLSLDQGAIAMMDGFHGIHPSAPLQSHRRGFQMKFTFEQKLTAVKLHKEKGTYKYPKGYEAKSKKQVYRFYVQFWEAQYDRNGEEGIRHGLNSAYSPEKKLSIITPVLMGEITGRQQAIRCGVRPSSIVLWIKRYRKDGLEGLKSCHPGRKPKNMPIISEKKEETDKTVAEDNQEDLRKRLKELEHENLLLHAELDYRKKLEALVEKRLKSERAKRPTPSSLSSKAKDTREK